MNSEQVEELWKKFHQTSSGINVVVSAPGKVLVSGAYVVLEQEYRGMVFAVSARFRTSIKPLSHEVLEALGVSKEFPQAFRYPIVVFAPQKEKTPILFNLDDSFILSSIGSTDNPFIQNTLQYAFSVIVGILGNASVNVKLNGGVTIFLKGDAAFYTISNSEYTGKTGLGSSAALCSSLCSALFNFFGILESGDTSSSTFKLVHDVSQFCHCAAQGKVGSGFDIATAFYGSQLYQRFNPEPMLNILGSAKTISGSLVLEFLRNVKNGIVGLDFQSKALCLPPDVYLLLGDVKGGSETTSMVKSVLQWRQKSKDTEEGKLWDQIGSCCDELNFLLSSFTGDGSHIRQNCINMRLHLRHLGKLANVPIEPNSQSKLLDITFALTNVLYTAVPGAGGHDAVFALIYAPQECKEDVIGEVCHLWAEHGVSLLHLHDKPSDKGIAFETQ